MKKQRVIVNDLSANAASELTEKDVANITGGAWYAKFDGVDGSLKQKDHKNQVNVESLSQPIFRVS